MRVKAEADIGLTILRVKTGLAVHKIITRHHGAFF